MNRRQTLVLQWTGWSLVATLVALGLAMWSGRRDDREIAPGERDVAGLTDKLARDVPDDLPSLRFVDHAARLALQPQFVGVRTQRLPEDMGGGLALADLDGDGDLDLLLVGTGTFPDGGPHRLLRNDTPAGGALALTDVTADSGLPGPLMGNAACVADTDADGDLDVLLTHLDGLVHLRNDGGLHFTDTTAESGLANAEGWCAGAAFGDVDADGDLDLYVCRYVAFRDEPGAATAKQYGLQIPYSLNPSSFSPLANLLYLGDGAGTFTGGVDLAFERGVANDVGRSLGAVFADFDLDGLDELYVANDVSDNVLFSATTDGDGVRQFADVSHRSATADYRGAMGLTVRDVDGDGDDDFFVTHWIAQENGFYRNLWFDERGAGGNLLFIDHADRLGLGALALDFVGWSTEFADLDLDGRPDLVVANGSTLEERADRANLVGERPLFFWNGGATGFFDAGLAWGSVVDLPRVHRGGAVGDLDGDGDLDVVLGSLAGPPSVLINDGPPRGASLFVSLRGPARNTFAVGARVTVRCGESTQSAEMRSAPGYCSSGPLALCFGLGTETDEVLVTVRWPDGVETEQRVPAGDTRVEVRR